MQSFPWKPRCLARIASFWSASRSFKSVIKGGSNGGWDPRCAAGYWDPRAQVTDQVGTPLEGFTFEDYKPFSGDDTAWSPEWRSGKKIGSLKGQFIRIEIELNSARLYAIRGKYVEIMAMAIARHREYG